MPLDPVTQLLLVGGSGAAAGGLAHWWTRSADRRLPSVPSHGDRLAAPLTPAGQLLSATHDLVMTVTEGVNASRHRVGARVPLVRTIDRAALDAHAAAVGSACDALRDELEPLRAWAREVQDVARRLEGAWTTHIQVPPATGPHLDRYVRTYRTYTFRVDPDEVATSLQRMAELRSRMPAIPSLAQEGGHRATLSRTTSGSCCAGACSRP